MTLEDGVYVGTSDFCMVRGDCLNTLLAGAFPLKPPRVWFDNPRFTHLSPLHIESSGQVRGHIASWKQSHIGMSGSVRAPRSRSKYAFFRTGVVEADDGSMVDVGQITLTGGHASIHASVADTVKHYDDTASAIMDVAVGEDRHGIWVAGALRPDVTENQLRAIRASSVSGDWRPINGGLELVAICAVNVPGLPIPRAKIASGKPVALVAAGVEPLVELALEEQFAAKFEDRLSETLNEVYERLDTIEHRNPAQVAADRREAISEALANLTTDTETKRNELRRRVKPEMVAASLRSRVHN